VYACVLDAAVDRLASAMGLGEADPDRATTLDEAAELFMVAAEADATASAALLGLFRVARLSNDARHLAYLENAAAGEGSATAFARGLLVQAYQYFGDVPAARSTADLLTSDESAEWLAEYAHMSLFWMDLWAGDFAGAERHLAAYVPDTDDEAELWRAATEALAAATGGDAMPIGDDNRELLAGPTLAREDGSARNVSVETYPNPFNPTTTLTLRLRTDERANVSVFDVVGRRIAQLHDGVLEAGVHRIRWTALDLPSGSYFIVVRTGTGVTTVPVIFQK
jgi:hypothetical protein